MKITILTLFSTLILLTSCDHWIDNAATPNESLTPEQISKPAMIGTVRGGKIEDGPLVANIKSIWSSAAPLIFLAEGAMVDEVSPGKQPNLLIYKQLKNDNINVGEPANGSEWSTLQMLLGRSEELLKVSEEVANFDTPQLEAVRAYAQYIGHLYAAYAYQLLSDSFSDNINERNAIRVGGKTVSLEEVNQRIVNGYLSAIAAAEKAELKAVFADSNSGLASRIATSLLTKYYIDRSDYTSAAKYINQTLNKGEVWQAIYNADGVVNPIYDAVGNTMREAQVDVAMMNKLQTDHERAAVQLKMNNKNELMLLSTGRYSPVTITDFNEMQLIRAELIIRNNLNGNAGEIMATVSGEQIETNVSLERIAHLRSVYLFLRGTRVNDIRRNLADESAVQTWQARTNKWMPFPNAELMGQ